MLVNSDTQKHATRVPRTTCRTSNGAVDGRAAWNTDSSVVKAPPLCLEQVVSMAMVNMAGTGAPSQNRSRSCHECRLHYSYDMPLGTELDFIFLVS
jgi:hypothetical protein